ncbi:class I SAM-dependent methyltransferase [Flavobacteriales bacterium]|nr:class I SAM-dependent methyltransferase [Flavobacteriales bacterium]
MQNWFVSWFNSPYYHILYKDRDISEAEAFVDKLSDYVTVPTGSRALDLACGKGRHSVRLWKNGYEVIGIDLSKDSIAEAKLNEKEGLDFFEHDMRELYWNDYFDVVVNLFTSFGYFHNKEDDQKTITSVADSLKNSGLFVIDFMNAVKVIENLVDYEEKTVDGVKFEITRSVEEDVIVKRIHVIDGEVELDFEEQVDALKKVDFQDYLNQAGMTITSTFGDYQLNLFEEKTSDRLIIIAKKQS